MTQFISQELAGWGNTPVETCLVTRPETASALHHTVANPRLSNYIGRGLGRAYGDAALNKQGGVILLTRLNRFLDFNGDTGILRCEAGVSLKEIVDVFLPQGWFLPTTPGTKHVTVGGAIAADVHGKNHHQDGSFGNFVHELKLVLPSTDVAACSPVANVDLFWATIGGMGLTGIILEASIQLERVQSAYYDVTYKRTLDLDDTLKHILATDANYRYSVAWIDCQPSRRSFGRGVLMLGNGCGVDDLPPRRRLNPFVANKKRPKSIPIHLPGAIVNSLSVAAFNKLYYWTHRNTRMVVGYDTYFYPLDAVDHWNRAIGKRGFIQYQVLFPPESARRGLIEVLEAFSRARTPPFLAVLKSTGLANPGMLSFARPGHTLALDMRNTGDDLRRLLRDVDEIVVRHHGRLYLAKDAMTSAAAFHSMYPRLGEFQSVKARIDPQNRIVSSQARRLGIVSADD